MVSMNEFLNVDIRVGTITDATDYIGAKKPAIKLWIDFGAEIGIKKTSAQITDHYDPKGLIGSQICAVVNFPPKQIGKFMSECLVLGASDDDGGISLLRPDHPIPNGHRIH